MIASRDVSGIGPRTQWQPPCRRTPDRANSKPQAILRPAESRDRHGLRQARGGAAQWGGTTLAVAPEHVLARVHTDVSNRRSRVPQQCPPASFATSDIEHGADRTLQQVPGHRDRELHAPGQHLEMKQGLPRSAVPAIEVALVVDLDWLPRGGPRATERGLHRARGIAESRGEPGGARDEETALALGDWRKPTQRETIGARAHGVRRMRLPAAPGNGVSSSGGTRCFGDCLECFCCCCSLRPLRSLRLESTWPWVSRSVFPSTTTRP